MKIFQGGMGLLCLSLAWLVLPSKALSQGTILPKACVDCHGSETKYPVRGARSQYLTSGHRTLGNASYANADDCQGCHTNEGFIERARTGKGDPKKFVRYHLPRAPRHRQFLTAKHERRKAGQRRALRPGEEQSLRKLPPGQTHAEG